MLPKILYQTNKCRKCCQNVAKDILSNEEKAKMLPEDLLLNEENVAKDLSSNEESPKCCQRSYRQIYAIQSSFRVCPLVDLTRSVTEPAPQYSITNQS